MGQTEHGDPSEIALHCHCARCGEIAVLPLDRIAQRHRRRPIGEVAGLLRCRRCGNPPAEVALRWQRPSLGYGGPLFESIRLV